MVSSELVVLLIVCVGINTGSALQGELLTLLYTIAHYTGCSHAQNRSANKLTYNSGVGKSFAL